jgi:hypothetical protein
VRCIYLVPFLASAQIVFSSLLPLQPLLPADPINDISSLLEKKSVLTKGKSIPSYHYACKVTDSIYGLEWEQENNPILCQYLDPYGNLVVSASFSPAFSGYQDVQENANEFINTNRAPHYWALKNKKLCYLHKMEPPQEHCLVTRDTEAESGSGSGMMEITDQTPDPTRAPGSPQQPEAPIDIAATTGGIVLIGSAIILIAALFAEAKYHCMLKGCRSLYNRVYLSLP